MSKPNLLSMFLPSSGVGYGESLHERGQISVVLWPEHEMPVIGHQAIRDDSHRPLFQSLSDNPFECQIVFVVKEKLLLANATIDNVVNESSWGDASGSWHAMNLATLALLSITGPVPVFEVAVGVVVIDDAHGLHEGITCGWSDKLPAQFFELLAHLHGLGGGSSFGIEPTRF